MKSETNPQELIEEIVATNNFLIVQDIDGVCIPLVKDPLKRKIDITYVESASKFNHEFAVLTNGEHEGLRGLNKVIGQAYLDAGFSKENQIYLPGLAAGGIEYQNHFGEVQYPGVTQKELDFLSQLPHEMERRLNKNLAAMMPMISKRESQILARTAVLATRFSPTINLNRIFSIIPNNIKLQKRIQSMLQELMSELIELAKSQDLENSFFLHVAPNLGVKGKIEKLKFATSGDVGTTDIQFMLSGAVKEAGLLVLINKYIQSKYGKSPLGEDFNVRNAPKSLSGLKDLCFERIESSCMPLLIGVGDTVTSNHSSEGKGWLRGGSDRGFLTLIQELGKVYNKSNKIILVDSSSGEVDRPSLNDKTLKGISDPEDPLRFTSFFRKGPSSYVEWFKTLAKEWENNAHN